MQQTVFAVQSTLCSSVQGWPLWLRTEEEDMRASQSSSNSVAAVLLSFSEAQGSSNDKQSTRHACVRALIKVFKVCENARRVLLGGQRKGWQRPMLLSP